MKRVLLIIALGLWLAGAHAGVDVYRFSAPEQEQRYKSLIAELRCLVCQNQNIADSNADLAKDLRQQVYEMINAGKSDQEIVAYMVARYGDFVLYKPPLKIKTGLLWAGPFLIAALGVFFLFRTIARKKAEVKLTLGAEERDRMRRLLERDGEES